MEPSATTSTGYTLPGFAGRRDVKGRLTRDEARRIAVNKLLSC